MAEQMKYSEAGLVLLRANLGYYSTEIPPELQAYLRFLMEYAFNDFSRKNIHLTPGVMNDDMDQVIYAAWMYRKGINGDGKTEMLKSIIRSRQISNALNDSEGSA